MQQSDVMRRRSRGFLSFGAIAGFLLAVAFGNQIMDMLPAETVADGSLQVVAWVAFFFLLLGIAIGSAVMQRVDTERLVYRLALVIWWILLVDEVYFSRVNSGYNRGVGEFSMMAYGEGIMWGITFMVLAILSFRQPAYLGRLFSGASKWLTLFTLFCLISIAWAPGKAYASAWGFKLTLVVLLLQLCASAMKEVDDIVMFLKLTCGAFALLTIVPAIQAFFDPQGPFDEGRLAGNPDLLAPTAASFMLIAIILHAVTKKRYYVFAAMVAAVVMLLSFGKAGILGGVLAATLFVMLQRKVVRSLGLLLGLAALAMLIISFTPVAGYLHSYQGGSTLTGRTVIWSTALSAIKNSPIIGHGYLGTYYSWENTSGLVSGTVHLHNGFLEVAYNQGAIGEILLLIIHFMIIRNVFASMRTSRILRTIQPRDEQAWHAFLLTIGMLAFYVHSFIQGLFGSDFGGRCMSPYMLFLAVFMVSDAIRRVNEEMLSRALASTDPVSSDPPLGALRFAPAQD